jgi:hypothetical protein
MKTKMMKTTAEKSTEKNSSHSRTQRLWKSLSGITLIMTLLILSSCQKDKIEPIQKPESIIPQRFMVEIPGSISSSADLKNTQVDTLQGNQIYEHLRTFIAVGEFGAELTQNVMLAIATYNLNRSLEITFISDEDGRSKHISIIENVSFEAITWQYRLTMTDVESYGIGMQVFWSLLPLKGIAIINPYNLNRNTEVIYEDTHFRTDYSEAGELGYDAHMIVSISGFPLPDPITNPFALNKMKMFVGKSGDVVTLYGNSLHPNAMFFTNQTGFNWAFAAAADKAKNIAVAEVGLPPMDLDASDRETILGTYSIHNVLSNQILSVWPTINPEVLDAYLYHTQAPGYFSQQGFVQGGTAPSQAWQLLEQQILTLTPYNPSHLLDLEIGFDE